MIPGQPVPTELDAAAERAAQRRATKWATPPIPASPAGPAGPPVIPPAPDVPDLGPPGRSGPGIGAAADEPAAVAPAPTAPPAPPATSIVPPLVLDPTMVGVVFIHGIGAQRAGETLLAWSA